MEQYKYEPLDLESPAIRLLRLHHGHINEISCELFQAELHQREDSVSYEALSYTWGSPHLTESILVNGYPMKITHNLHEALLHLRRDDEDRILWVDAVCIDQANLKERGHQVAQMADIYREADRVIFRLGPGTCETDVFMESLQFLQQASVKHACRDWKPQDSRWQNLWVSFQPLLEVFHAQPGVLQQKGLKEILDRPWFRRVWILQEAAFARAGIISCGTKSVSARLFGLAPWLVGVTPDKHCQSVIDIMPSPWRRTSWWSRSRTLYALLRAFGGSEATDKRDLVYALRAMSSDFSGTNKLVPDYEKSEEDLARDAFRAIYLCEPERLEPLPRPLSIIGLIDGLQSTNGDKQLLDLLTRSPTREIMEAIFQNCKYIPVNQHILSTAAQHDDTGEVVELLLRHRGDELNVDDDTFMYAALNVKGAVGVMRVLSRHQGQAVVPERLRVAAAKNPGFADAIMDFLVSLNIVHDDRATIAEALTGN